MTFSLLEAWNSLLAFAEIFLDRKKTTPFICRGCVDRIDSGVQKQPDRNNKFLAEVREST
jgi:hypothetical protein